MAHRVQAGATTRVPSYMIIITEHTVWTIIDTLPPLRQGANTRVPMHMSHPHGMGRIFIDTLLRAQESAMTKVHKHMSHHHGTTRNVFDMHRLMIAIDLHLRVIVIAIVQLLIVTDIDMSLHQGTKRTVIAVHPLAHRCSPAHTGPFRLKLARRTVDAVNPLAHRRSPPHTATFRLDQDRHMRRPTMEIHQDPRW